MAQSIPDDPNTQLRREKLAAALTAAGYPTALSTLATKATRGGGPPYRLYGRVPIYRWGDALAWAESRMSLPRCSSSEGEQRTPSPVGAATEAVPAARPRGRPRKRAQADEHSAA